MAMAAGVPALSITLPMIGPPIGVDPRNTTV